MKTLLSVTAIICALHSSSIAQEWKLAVARPSNPISVTVPEGNIIEFGTPIASDAGSFFVNYDFGGGAVRRVNDLNMFGATTRYVGPLVLSAGVFNDNAFVSIPYRITNPTSAATVVPSNAVVIPTNATGNVQIILESSTDLVNWVNATPGTYGSSTQSRFFRVRAVQQ